MSDSEVLKSLGNFYKRILKTRLLFFVLALWSFSSEFTGSTIRLKSYYIPALYCKFFLKNFFSKHFSDGFHLFMCTEKVGLERKGGRLISGAMIIPIKRAFGRWGVSLLFLNSLTRSILKVYEPI